MKGFLQGLAALAAALVLQVVASHRVPSIQRTVDLVLLVVVFYGSCGARVGAMFAGALGGLLEDVWFGDLMGIHGFTKTLIGYVLGGLGSRFDLAHPGARVVAVLIATLIDRIVEPIVMLGLGMHASPPEVLELVWRCAGNGIVGGLLFSLAGKRALAPA